MRFILLLYAVVVIEGQQLWNAQNFPNPTRGQFKECGMLTTSQICDPDGVLDVASRNRLDYELKQLERRTSQTNGHNFCEKKGVTPAMAIAKRVQGGSTEDVKSMANSMLRTWQLDQQCKKSVVIVVSVEDSKFWVARDDKVPVYANEFTEIFKKHAPLFQRKQYTEALNNILQSTWEKALEKQGPARPPSGGGKQQPSPPGFGDTGGRGTGGGGGGKGFNMPKWIWLVLIMVVIPLLCCCCCIYCCCCRGKGGSAGRQPVPQDYPAGEGGGGPFPPNPGMGGRGGGGGGRGPFGNFMSTLGGAGIGSMVGNFLSNRNRGGESGGMGMSGMGGGGGMGGGAGYGGGDYQGGGAYPAPPQPVYDDNGEDSKGLYPSVAVKDEGGGGSWA